MTMIASMALDHALHATGLKTLSSELSGLSIVNEAGEFLVSMHAWDWLVRPSAALDTVASQSYVELPSDLMGIVSIEATDSYNNAVQLTSLDQLLALRTDTSAAAGWLRYAAVLWAEGSDGIPAPRLELWPTPGTSESGVFTVYYRAGWTEITDDADTIRMPSWMHGLFLSIVRAIALGYEDQDAASKAARLAEVQASPEYQAAKERDCSMQIDFGTIQGGAAQRGEWPVSSDWPWVGPTP